MFDFLKSPRTPNRTGWTMVRDSCRQQAEICERAGNLAEAERHLIRAVDESDRCNAPHVDRVELRLELADVQRKKAAPELARDPDATVESKRAMLTAAEKTVRRAIEIVTATADPREFVVCLIALADVFADARDFVALEKVEREALRLGAALPHPELGLIAARTHRLGIALHWTGKTEEAAKHLDRSMELHEKRFGAASLEMADVLVDCGAVFRSQGNHERAKQCLQRALYIHEAAKGPDSPETFADVQQLARVLEESGDLDGAAHQYERALLMKMRKLGVGNLEDIAEMQYRLANLHIGWGNLARARELLEECVGEFRRHGGPRFAVALEMLAQLEERLGHYNAAVDELEKAGRAWEKCGPSRTQELIRNLEYRIDLLEQLRRTKDANWLRERMAELQNAMTAQA